MKTSKAINTMINSIQYPISIGYVSHWNELDVVREFLSNAYDSDNDFIVHYANNTLVIENKGVIPMEGFLLGNSIKHSDSIGKFGEGMKIALLTALRLGMPVKIESGDFIAVPKVSQMLNTSVLQIEFYQKEYQDKTIVKIENVQNFNQYRDSFLFLKERKNYHGNFLINESGIFVKGVRLPNVDKSLFGYNLDIELSDRDRTSASDYKSACKSVLYRYFKNTYTTDSTNIILKVLENEDSETIEYSFQFYGFISNSVSDFIRSIYGEKAVLSDNPRSDKKAEWIGYRVITPKNPFSKSILENIYQYSSKVSLNHEMSIITAHKINDNQKMNLKIARKIANKVGFDHKKILIYRNEGQEFVGLYKSIEGNIYLREDVLEDTEITIDTVIHELAHWYSNAGDLTTEHAHAMTKISAIILADYVRH